ncbi:hypothetical protein E5D57_002412 [Metarhizium anisopliae]|nr:hypothetical protein E5D57_002412 [Metarhizium anisopliae]
MHSPPAPPLSPLSILSDNTSSDITHPLGHVWIYFEEEIFKNYCKDGAGIYDGPHLEEIRAIHRQLEANRNQRHGTMMDGWIDEWGPISILPHFSKGSRVAWTTVLRTTLPEDNLILDIKRERFSDKN